jgi:hypothetical protein
VRQALPCVVGRVAAIRPLLEHEPHCADIVNVCRV